MSSSRFLISLAACALLGSTLSLSAQNIGVVSYAEPTLRGTPPGAATRSLQTGTGIFADERVASSASGRAQLMFLDQTTLSLGPNTTIVLDSFVFDPSTGGGEMGVNLAEGTLRFIGGSLSRDREATVTTPSATIGIRGSTGIVSHIDGETAAVFVAGQQMCISAGSGRSCTSRQGGVLTRDGYIGRVDPAYLGEIVAQVAGARPQVGATGASGAGAAPTTTTPQGTGQTGDTGGSENSATGFDSSQPVGGPPNSTTGVQFDRDIFGNQVSLNTLMRTLTRQSGRTPRNCVFSPFHVVCN